MDLLESFYRHDADMVAAMIGKDIISYGRMRYDIEVMSKYIHDHGIGLGARVIIYMHEQQSYWSWIAHLGAMRLGVTHSTVNSIGKVEKILRSSRIHAVIGQVEDIVQPLESVRIIPFSPSGNTPLVEQISVGAELNFVVAADKAQRLALTSGTTGSAKTLVWTNAVIQSRIAQVGKSAGIDATTWLMPMLGLGSTGGFRYPLATWLAGGCVLFASPSKNGIQFYPNESSNLVVASPNQLRFALQHTQGIWRNRAERHIILLGGRLPGAVRDEALNRACGKLSINYGSTETGNVASGDAALIDRHPGAAGIVRSSVTVEIVNQQGDRQPTGQSGIVRIRTPDMVDGYEDHSAPVAGTGFQNGWFYPGDLGVLHEDGMLAIIGRVGDTINLGGVKVSAIALESQLESLPGVDDLCALRTALDDRDMLTIAVVGTGEMNLSQLRKLIAVKLPKDWKFNLIRVPRIARNTMGKVQRQMLAEHLAILVRQEREKLHNVDRSCSA